MLQMKKEENEKEVDKLLIKVYELLSNILTVKCEQGYITETTRLSIDGSLREIRTRIFEQDC